MGWMDRDSGSERNVLERILVLLLALADLADRASALPAPARVTVLAILAQGEAEARSFVSEMACGWPVQVDAAPCPVVDDAGRLALSYRALALALCAMLAVARGPRQSPACAVFGQADLPMLPRAAALPDCFHALPAPDTS